MNIEHIISRTIGKSNFVIKERAYHAVVVILLMEINNELHLVFQKRSQTISRPGEICFPGGKVEKTDSSLQNAAAREVEEEMGILPEDLSLYHKLFRLNTMHLGILDVFLGYTSLTSLEQMNINPHEVADIFSLPLSFFIKAKPESYSVPSQYIIKDPHTNKVYFPYVNDIESVYKEKNIWDNMPIPLLVYKTEKAIIWGFTALILHTFIQMLESDGVIPEYL